MKSEHIIITGMSCNHCVKSVEKEISKLPLIKYHVAINSLDAEFDETEVSHEDIVKAIEEAGYEVENSAVETI